MNTQANVPIKGSWEELLVRAEELGANYNDEAIPIYQKLVTRLGKLPVARRRAAGERLQSIYRSAVSGLLEMFLMRERYDEAIVLFDAVISQESADEIDAWQAMRRAALVQAGRPDAAIAELRAIAQEPDGDLEDWYRLASLQSQLLRYENVTATIVEMEAWIVRRHGNEISEARKRDEAVVEATRAVQQIGLQCWQTGIDHYLRAIELDPAQRDMLPEVYLDLLLQGQYGAALPLIRRDQPSQVRPNFWLGYISRQTGDEDAAVRSWSKAVGADLENPDNRQYVEYLLSAFYLEDRRDGALSAVLNILQRGENRQWPLFYLAGLGWALRGNLKTARADLETALLQCRASLDGRLLPYEFWIHVRALLPPDVQDKLAIFFDVNGGKLQSSDAAPDPQSKSGEEGYE